MLKTLPDTPERAQQELTLQITLGPALMATKGFGAPEVERAYTRARELCQQVGETPQLFPALWGLWAFYLCARGISDGTRAGGAAPHASPERQDPALLLEAHYTLGVTLYVSESLL